MNLSTPPANARALTIVGWLILLVLFAALRVDTSERVYFPVDDQVVLWLVDELAAPGNHNWQPDWNRISDKRHDADYFRNEGKRTDLPHAHHYNFSAHILLSAVAVKTLRTLGNTLPTIVLLHHIAFFWDTVSWLLLIGMAFRLGGLPLAMSSALIYSLFPLAVQGSHYARPDAFLTCMGTAMLWLALRVRDWPRGRWLVLNGLVLGAAIVGKASQLLLGIFPAIASCSVWLCSSPRNAAQPAWHHVLRSAGDGVALMVITALVIAAIFYVTDMSPQDFWISLQSIQLYYQHPGPPDVLAHYSFAIQLMNIAHYFYATLGWPLIIAMLLGVAALVQRADKLPLLLLTLPFALFTLYFASVPAFFDRSFCSLAAAMVLLAAVGCVAVIQKIPAQQYATFFAVMLTLLACYTPARINYYLQTDLLRSHHNDTRLAFQQQLKQQWSHTNSDTDFWIKNIDKSDQYSLTIPERPPKNPRIYVMEYLNDWNSEQYLQTLTRNGFVQIAEWRSPFYEMPTSSLITVHEAARFVYFVRAEDIRHD